VHHEVAAVGQEDLPEPAPDEAQRALEHGADDVAQLGLARELQADRAQRGRFFAGTRQLDGERGVVG
jgi:hypothetical protein